MDEDFYLLEARDFSRERFTDVPINHWSYDAIGQLAAHGILSGYPDGLYKGQQMTTRYEMASAISRALAVVDMTKASKEDVEVLKRLVVEFKDELEALGVRVDELDERVAVLEERLGGWHIHGELALDLTYKEKNEAPDSDSTIEYDDAKLFIERTWGDDNEYFFRARFNNDSTAKNSTWADRFYAEMPFFFDSRLTVGRFNWDWESEYRIKSNIGKYETGGFDGAVIFTDWTWNGLGLTKNFSLGTIQAVIAHPDKFLSREQQTQNYWMFMLRGSFQFTEKFGLDIGGVYNKNDNAENLPLPSGNIPNLAMTYNNLWEIFAGLRFNFNENIAFKGVYYHMKYDWELVNTATGAKANFWPDDDPNHWAVIFDIKQEALKYTSLWLEYGKFEPYFMAKDDNSIYYSPALNHALAAGEVKYWRVAAGQEWNDKWSTHIFYYGYEVDPKNGRVIKAAEMGVGVQYKLNDYTTMGLNYVHVKDSFVQPTDTELVDDNIIRFRTSVSF